LIMKRNKKALFVIIMTTGVILIVGFIFLIVNAFAGNPVSKSIAKNKIQKYVQTVYSSDIQFEKTYYFAKEGLYISEVKIYDKINKFGFSSNMIGDSNVKNYFKELFEKDCIKACKIFTDNIYIESPERIFTSISTGVVADGNYSSDFEKLNIQQKLYLMGIRNSYKEISEDDSKQMAAKIAKQFIDELGSKYNFKSIQMIYIDKFGVYEIIIDNKTLTLDELLKHTKKRDANEIGEEEKDFIERLNIT